MPEPETLVQTLKAELEILQKNEAKLKLDLWNTQEDIRTVKAALRRLSL